jgi:hypothetical protein
MDLKNVTKKLKAVYYRAYKVERFMCRMGLYSLN